MQQTFPAGTAQKIVIFDIDGNLIVRGWDQQTIQVTSGESIEQVQPEGDTLTIRGCNDDVEILVPVETIIGVKSVDGEVSIENVRQVEVDAIAGDVSIKNISGNAELAEIDGDAFLTSIGGELALTDVAGDLIVKQASSVRVGGKIGGDAAFLAVTRLEIERVDGDLKLEETQETTAGRVGGDLKAKNGIAVLRGGSIGGDCQLQSEGNADVSLENVGGDLVVTGVARLQASNVGSDCVVQGSASAELTIGNVSSDLRVIGAARVQVSNIGSDCDLRDVQGNVSLGHVGSDAHILGVGGNLRVGNIGSDAQLKGIGGSISAGNIGSDLHLQATFPAASKTHITVGSDARIILPDDANLTIRASVGGNVSGRSIVSNFAGNFVNLVYGEGSALLELNVGGDLNLRGNANPRSSSSVGGKGSGGNWSGSEWGNFGNEWDNFGRDFGHEMADFGREMEHFGHNLGRDISEAVHEATSSIGSDVASSVSAAKEQARRAQREAEERRRAEQDARRAEREGRRTGEREGRKSGERDPYFNVRINDREWKMGPERIEAIIEQARQAASEGIQGALQAVEQALKNLRVPSTPPMPPKPATPPTPPGPGTPPAAAAYSASTTPENVAQNEPGEQPPADAPVNPEQEREAILRMIAEGRISPEEGDLLLEALGS